jgi:hypothetical protein
MTIFAERRGDKRYIATGMGLWENQLITPGIGEHLRFLKHLYISVGMVWPPQKTVEQFPIN